MKTGARLIDIGIKYELYLDKVLKNSSRNDGGQWV